MRRPNVRSRNNVITRGITKNVANVQSVASCNVHHVVGMCGVGASCARAQARCSGAGSRSSSKRTFLHRRHVEKKHAALHVALHHDVGVRVQHGESASTCVLPRAEGREFILDDGPINHLRDVRGASGAVATRDACRSDVPSMDDLPVG